MSQRLKILVLATTVAIILLIVSLLFNSRTKSIKTVEVPMPTKVVVPTREVIKYFSDTGAKYISPTNSEYTVGWLIGNLRDKLPLTLESFSMNYDYKSDKFMVNIKDGTEPNRQLFVKWMASSGYDQIPSQLFVIK